MTTGDRGAPTSHPVSPEEQLVLLGPAPTHAPAGRVELAVAKAVDAARLADVDAGAGAVAIELGRSLDVAARRADPWAAAAVSRELREQLSRLRMDPAAREAGVDGELERLLRDLGTPTAGDDADAAPTP